MTPRIDALHRRHEALEAELDAELKRPAPDQFTVRRIKMAKLRLKDRIAETDDFLRRRRRKNRHTLAA